VISDADIRSRLDLERRAALDAITSMEGEFEELVASVANSNLDDEHDPEGATIAFERAQLAAQLGNAHTTLVAVEEAFQMLAEGRYGICEQCGSRITEERLIALPWIRVCYSCAASR
jgi:DnaK suppressor protein